MTKLVIIDTGGANISSIINAFEALEVQTILTCDPKIIRSAGKIILPGVGAAGACMERLQEMKLRDLIPTLTQPVFGICLGMQILFDYSAEGETPCLGIIEGKIQRLDNVKGMSVPHMGWNTVEILQSANPLVAGIPASGSFYFANSYYAPQSGRTVGVSHYSAVMTAIVQKNNFWGVQFHPERSGTLGLQLLRNFVTL
ncbi:MAG: imidazole glycerol phosphate synthase subunit HisH [Pseudomonadota bacterium]